MKIRKMQTSDLKEVQNIETENFSVPWNKEMFVEEIEKQYAFVYENQNIILGYLCGWRIIDEFHITNFAVRKKFQRNGIGQLLLNYILIELDKNYFQSILLEVRESNEIAISFYIKNKFSVIGARKNYYHKPLENAIIMFLDLSKTS